MSPRLLTILRTIGTVMLLWFAYRMLERVHTVFVLLAIVISSANVIILWMTRYYGKAASDFSRFPVARKYVELVCRMANMQQPCHPSAKNQSDHWLCQTDHDYLRAVRNLQQSIRGHDETIAEIVGSIKNSVKLRSRRRNKPGSVIASFLLAGPDGIGKTYLIRQLARQLYSHADCLVVDCKQATYPSLFGSPGVEGHLLTSIRRQPWQLVCLQHIDAASSDLQAAIGMIVSRGSYQSPQQQIAETSFENTILCLTTVPLAEAFEPTADNRLSTQQLQQILEQESGIDADLLRRLSLTLSMAMPSPVDKSEVISQRLIDETTEHGLKLSYVDPLLIASEVTRVTADSGFTHLHSNIKKLLSKPLLEASSQGANELSLHVRSFTPDLSQENSHEPCPTI